MGFGNGFGKVGSFAGKEIGRALGDMAQGNDKYNKKGPSLWPNNATIFHQITGTGAFRGWNDKDDKKK